MRQSTAMELILVTLASGLAGFVDAIVGGGGLILVPALFATYVAASPATLLGTNKSASVWGTLFATYQYSQRVHMNWAVLLPAAVVTMQGRMIAEAVLSGKAVERIANSALDEIVVTDTIPLSAEAAKCPRIRVISISGLLAETMLRISNEDSVSSLFVE